MSITIFIIYMVSLKGVDFRFFWKIDMKGPYLENIGKTNHVLEKKKLNCQIFA